MSMFSTKKILIATAVLAAVASFAAMAGATHSWGSYHWARTANPFALKLGDNVSGVWDGHLAVASGDWSLSSALNSPVVASGKNPRSCKPTKGRVEVCNSSYGNNGWLGVAQIWVSGSHITQGTVRVNDYYFNWPSYNTPEWKQFVMCQEIGHTFGLDHQDEDFNNPNLGSCMDYTSDPASNQHPNLHDYEMLEVIYKHLDTSTTLSQSTSGHGANADVDTENKAEWGREVRKSKDGRASLYERDLGKGHKLFTFVIWAE